MFPIILLHFVAFPESNNALIKKNAQIVNTHCSGSSGLYYDGKCHQTYPNETITFHEKMDWCSAIARDNEKPWITYEIKGKSMKLNGFSVRNGCCWYDCCCLETGEVVDYICCCRLYSFSLHGSNDNVSWKLIHKVEKELRFYECEYKHYDFPLTESFRYIKFVMDQQRPGCPRCMQINQMELYGITVDTQFSSYEDDDNDESISIIGKVTKAQE